MASQQETMPAGGRRAGERRLQQASQNRHFRAMALASYSARERANASAASLHFRWLLNSSARRGRAPAKKCYTD
jgi:hypothetical protein